MDERDNEDLGNLYTKEELDALDMDESGVAKNSSFSGFIIGAVVFTVVLFGLVAYKTGGIVGILNLVGLDDDILGATYETCEDLIPEVLELSASPDEGLPAITHVEVNPAEVQIDKRVLEGDYAGKAIDCWGFATLTPPNQPVPINFYLQRDRRGDGFMIYLHRYAP